MFRININFRMHVCYEYYNDFLTLECISLSFSLKYESKFNYTEIVTGLVSSIGFAKIEDQELSASDFKLLKL